MTLPSQATRSADPNSAAARRIAGAEPVLVGAERAGDALGLGEGELGHAGPPFLDARLAPAPVVNALAGAAVHEGWAGTLDEGRRLIARGEVRLRSNHDLGTVSPMAGVVRPSQTVMRIEDRAGSGVAYATLAEAGKNALRFGVYNAAVADHLRWLDEELGAALESALPPGGLPLLPIIAQGVALGDDVHQRNVGGMTALIGSLSGLDGQVRAWLSANPQHALNYAMAAAKLALDRAEGTTGSSVVTALSRNGVECGIRLAGTGRRWFTAPATIPHGGFFGPFTLADAQPDLGDSAIVEAYGLGGTIAHAAPELSRTMGRPWAEAQASGAAMRRLFVARHPPHGSGALR